MRKPKPTNIMMATCTSAHEGSDVQVSGQVVRNLSCRQATGSAQDMMETLYSLTPPLPCIHAIIFLLLQIPEAPYEPHDS